MAIQSTPEIWADDADGIKFASALQRDWTFSSDNLTLIDWQWNNDRRTERCFAYAILMTHEPQLMLLTDPNGIYKGSHATVVYGVTNGTLLIADPNFLQDSSENRRAEFDPAIGVYRPYYSGPTAGTANQLYTDYVYLAKTSVASWESADTHWREMAAGRLGPITRAGTYQPYAAQNTLGNCNGSAGSKNSATFSHWGSGFSGTFSFEYDKDSKPAKVSGTFKYP